MRAWPAMHQVPFTGRSSRGCRSTRRRTSLRSSSSTWPPGSPRSTHPLRGRARPAAAPPPGAAACRAQAAGRRTGGAEGTPARSSRWGAVGSSRGSDRGRRGAGWAAARPRPLPAGWGCGLRRAPGLQGRGRLWDWRKRGMGTPRGWQWLAGGARRGWRSPSCLLPAPCVGRGVEAAELTGAVWEDRECGESCRGRLLNGAGSLVLPRARPRPPAPRWLCLRGLAFRPGSYLMIP